MEGTYEDEDGQIRRRSKKATLEGYNSDSENNSSDSDVNESTPEEELKAEDGNADRGNDEDDMFASDNEVEDKKPKESKKKNLDIDQFEKDLGVGQYDEDQLIDEPWNAGLDLDEDEKLQQQRYYSNIEQLGEEDLQNRPKAEIAIESFDLRKEQEEGEFDRDLNFIAKKNTDDEEDEAWLQDAKKEDIMKAKLAQSRSQNASRKRPLRPVEALLSTVIELLDPAETPLEALGRLNPKRQKSRQETTTTNPQLKQAIVDLTGACDELMQEKALNEVYDMSREELMRLYKSETGKDFESGRGKKRAAEEMDHQESEEYGEKIWEFRWLGDETVQGPFSAFEMHYWKDNYFDNKVEVRKVGDTVFIPVEEVVFQ